MGKDAIVNFADEQGISRRKPYLRDVVTDEQVDQVKYARSQGITWAAIARYFKEEYGIEYGITAYKNLVANS